MTILGLNQPPIFTVDHITLIHAVLHAYCFYSMHVRMRIFIRKRQIAITTKYYVQHVSFLMHVTSMNAGKPCSFSCADIACRVTITLYIYYIFLQKVHI